MMFGGWENGLLIFFRTVSQILTAAVAITAFSLFLFTLSLNLRDRVVRTFLLILICVVIVFSAEAIGSAAADPWQTQFWLRFHWVGIILLPPVYLHFSDALLATTGRPSRWRRIWAVRASYLISSLFLISLVVGIFTGEVVLQKQPAPHLAPTALTEIFTGYYLLIMVLAWVIFVRAYRRTVTSTSQRRMRYLVVGALAPAFGSFPYLLFSSSFAANHPLFFWVLAAIINFLLGGLIVGMSYSVSFFGVSWPDRVIKGRLFKWIMRGPVTASFTLAVMTIVRRTGVLFGINYSALVPIFVVLTILMLEYLITLLSPIWERFLFYGKDREEITLLQRAQERLLTRNDLQQYLEMVLAAICDRLQAPGAYLVTLNGSGLELSVEVGKVELGRDRPLEHALEIVHGAETRPKLFIWGEDYLAPIFSEEDHQSELIGLLGISKMAEENLDSEQEQDLNVLIARIEKVLQDRIIQEEAFRTLEVLAPEMSYIQEARAAGRYNGRRLLEKTLPSSSEDLTQWVKDALTHYWGGPKLAQSPLLDLKIVKNIVEQHEGNYSQALRSILRSAIEKVKPEGERRFTGDWILYNILDMKFLEGRKVRDVAMRLAMSEADLYRKQRIAIDEVARTILEMESQAGERVEERR
ncbi:MAG: hypothetical protein IT308_13075 [Anaerolineaceae bacterium]|nr:hypothetical protein [Anaerolineaceae bacterium]